MCPTYVYEIDGTDKRFELFQHMKEEPITDIDGLPVHRVPAIGRNQVHIGSLGEGNTHYPQICNSQPATMLGCHTVMHNGRRKAVFLSRKDKLEVMAKNDLVSQSAVYDT